MKLAEFKNLGEQFWSHVTKGEKGSCWSWHGARTSAGYPALKVDGKVELASRIGWKVVHGTTPPDSRVILHTCDNEDCVNPAHWKLTTQAKNMQDMSAKGRGKPHGKENYQVLNSKEAMVGPCSLASFSEELRKIAAPLTPAGRLAHTGAVGAPKLTRPAGPTPERIGKPVGYGRQLPRAV